MIYISCGCPSPRVAGHGSFGVRLMLDPKVRKLSLILYDSMQLDWMYKFSLSTCIDIEIYCIQEKFVAEAMSAIASSTNVPVTVKCRIGVDDHDSYDELCKDLYYTFLCKNYIAVHQIHVRRFYIRFCN